MPWEIVEGHDQCPSSEPWAVIKSDDGEVEGCHETQGDAQDQLAALNATEEQTMGDKLTFRRALVERAQGEPGSPIRFVGATEGEKADGIDLRMDGVDLSRFRSNPVVLWSHNYTSLPIGRGDPVVDGGKLMIDVTFDQDDDFAQRVERKVRDGFLSTGSIGFDFDVREWMESDDPAVREWELREFSIVPVPLDPDALVESGREALRHIHSQLAEVVDHEPEPDPEPQIDVVVERLRGIVVAELDKRLPSDPSEGAKPSAGQRKEDMTERGRHVLLDSLTLSREEH